MLSKYNIIAKVTNKIELCLFQNHLSFLKISFLCSPYSVNGVEVIIKTFTKFILYSVYRILRRWSHCKEHFKAATRTRYLHCDVYKSILYFKAFTCMCMFYCFLAQYRTITYKKWTKWTQPESGYVGFPQMKRRFYLSAKKMWQTTHYRYLGQPTSHQPEPFLSTF